MPDVWSGLSHAHGPADDTPGHLVALALRADGLPYDRSACARLDVDG